MKVILTITIHGEIGDDPQHLANLKGESKMIASAMDDVMYAADLEVKSVVMDVKADK